MTKSLDDARSELLACPFCGGNAFTLIDGRGRWQTSCTECHCGTPQKFERHDFAEAAWNTRAAPARCDAESADVAAMKWLLHKQPKDQIGHHEFSIWCDDEPVVLANVMPGQEGVLATIVAILNSVSRAALVPPPSEGGRKSQLPKFDYCCHGIERKYCDQCPDALSPDPGTVAVEGS